jgi:hypothetical protein
MMDRPMTSTQKSARITELESERDRLRADREFLLSWAPKNCPKGLDPTFYFTMNYEDDAKLQERIDLIRSEARGF